MLGIEFKVTEALSESSIKSFYHSKTKTLKLIEIVCQVCKYKIYSDDNLKSMYYILKLYNFQCPSCGSRLTTKDYEVLVAKSKESQ